MFTRTVNAQDLASELASLHLERMYTDKIVIWEEDGKYYTEEANELFHIFYMDFFNLIESKRV
jgi:hypothetical protein